MAIDSAATTAPAETPLDDRPVAPATLEADPALEHRVLLRAPAGRDAAVVKQVLAAQSIDAHICDSADDLVLQLERGAGAAFVTEEALNDVSGQLAAWIDRQSPWSDFPFVVLVSRRAGRRPSAENGLLKQLGNVVLLERPLNAETLVTAALSTLRARARQYEARSYLMAEAQARQAEHQARLEAERAGRMKDEFLSTLSHELRTPLSAILGWTFILKRPNVKPPDVAKAAATIERNARAQAQLIEELLDVSRITSGNLKLDIQRVSVATVFEAVVQSLKPASQARGIEVELDRDTTFTELMADSGRFQQIVWNLVSNAIKFTDRGGRVSLKAALEGADVLVSVVDTGLGIAAEFLPHVFERFRQADSSESRSFGGLGLGLAIVRQLVEMHGGAVAAHSDGLGHGSTFTVRLPAAQQVVPLEAPEETAPVTPPAAAPAVDLTGVRVLVVDDELDGREMIAQLLQGHGAAVETAGSAEEALSALGRSSPDVLISDIGMARVDGYELVSRVRRLERAELRNLPAIALTAFARTEDATKARRAGFDVHLPKPVEPVQLMSTIAGLLNGRCRKSV